MNYCFLKSYINLFVVATILFSSESYAVDYSVANLYQQQLTDTVKDKRTARRDEYFKDVQITVDDKPSNVSFNKPYDKLTDTEKEYYLSFVPEKEKAKGINESDFNSFTKNNEAAYYLDNIKTSREDILNKPREYYACGGSKRSDSDRRYYFYTYPYFENHIKHINDHYHEKEYKITILNEAREYLMAEKAIVPKKETYEREGHANDGEHHAAISFISYGYTDDINNRKKEVWAHFPGGKDKFCEYLFSNIKVPYDLSEQELRIDFTINTDGSLSNISMDEDTDPILAEEVRRVMLGSPRWIPWQEKGLPQPMGTRDRFKK